jgi:hypothetical protein
MQRAAASASLVTPSEPSLKRQKLSSPASPASPASPSPDWQATPASQEVLNRQAAEAGETHWVLSFQEDREASKRKDLHVIGTSFARLDDPKTSELRDDEQDGQGWRSNSVVGRKRFGNFTRVWEVISTAIQLQMSIYAFTQGSRSRVTLDLLTLRKHIRMQKSPPKMSLHHLHTRFSIPMMMMMMIIIMMMTPTTARCLPITAKARATGPSLDRER